MRSFVRGAVCGLATAICLSGSSAAVAAVARSLPNHDAFLSSTRRLPVVTPTSVAGKVNPGKAMQVEPRLGVPSFVWTNGTKAQLPAGMLTPGKDQAVDAARAFLSGLAPLYGLQGSDLSGATLYEATDPARAPITVTFKRQIDGIEVFRDRIVVVMTKDLTPVAVSGYLPASDKGIATAARFVKTPEAAAASAIADLTGASLAPSALKDPGRQNGPYRYLELAGPASVSLATPVRWKKTVYHLPERLVPAYYLEVDVLDDSGSPTLWAYVQSAEDGSLLHRSRLTEFDSFSYRVWAQTSGVPLPDDGPQGTAQSPHPTGNSDGTPLSYIAPSLLTLQNGPISTNDPWLPAGATETTGNNVDAYVDLVAPDGFNAGDLRASVTAPGAFDRVYDVAQAPGASAAQQMAAVTQLFFLNNFLHDWFYDVGFNEAAGNAQTNNFGRGGLGGDPILAQGQDYGGTNNANMSTPADGGSPRMQMYVFSGKSTRLVTVGASNYLPGISTTFGAQTFNLTGTVVLNNDGTAPTSDGCEASPAGAYTGQIVVIDRGTCGFTVKTKNAQNAGAIGVIIANNVAGAGSIAMGGTDATVTIGALSVSMEDGTAIKAALGGSPSGTLLRTAAGVGPDGTIDNGISGHEWGHYLSHRLVPSLGSTQAGGMGEGWSDFVGLLLLRRQGEALGGVYASGAYAPQGMSIDSLYYGIRRYPYSTNFAKSPLTFKHITTGQALPVGPPRDGAIGSTDNAEVHNTGEVWCAMLWEAYSELLAATEGGSPRLTFSQAQTRMLTYLVAGLKATPADPTFTEARDALLAVAAAADAQDFLAFCSAFSRRGIGTGAVSPDRASTTNTGVVESFVCGGDLAYVSTSLDDSLMSCDNDGILDMGEKGLLHVSVKNTGGTALSGTTASASSTNPMVVFPLGNSVNLPASAVGQTVSGTIQVVLNSGASGMQGMPFTVSYDDPGLYVAGPRTASYDIAGNANNLPATSASDDVESPTPAWTATNTGGSPWSRVADTPLAHHWNGPDNGGVSDILLTSPPLQVAAAGSFSFTFQTRYAFEYDGTYWDGGVIEISTNGGGTWTDIGASAVPGYNGTIYTGASNPLSGRLAYGGTSTSYPAYIPVTVSLGTTYQGQTVQVRFRVGSDQATSAAGWDIDSIAFTGITNTPFPTFVAQTSCTVLPVELVGFDIE